MAMGSETTLLDYQGPPLLAKSVQILGVGRGKEVEAQLWVGEDKLDGWIILVKAGANILGISLLSLFKVDLSKGKLYCAAASDNEAIAGVPKSMKSRSKSKTEAVVVNEECEVVPAREPLFPSQYPYGAEALKGGEEAQGVQRRLNGLGFKNRCFYDFCGNAGVWSMWMVETSCDEV